MTNKEFSVGDLKSCPGVSDHDMIMFNFFVKPERLVSRARKIYLCHKADLASLKQSINDVYSELISRRTYDCVDNLWFFSKNTLYKLIDGFVPFKYAKTNSNLRWVNARIRKEIRKKERLFKRAKRSGSHVDSVNFKAQRKKVKHITKKAHDDYVNSYILNDVDQNHKRFWKYIKAKRFSNTSMKCLIKNGHTFTKTKDILDSLNATFYEAFSQDNNPFSETANAGQIDLNFPDMPAIAISCSGVKALIDGLDSSKAPGPDHISPKLLKLIPEEASRCLKIIFESSLRKSEVLSDWKKASITPLDPNNKRGQI